MSTTDESGRCVWYDLMSSDVEGSTRFYQQLLGWTTEDVPMGEHTYHMIKNGEDFIGGIVPMDTEQGLPTHWIVYMAVADIEAACARVQELGGAVRVPTVEIPPGRFAVVNDPQGAYFSLWQGNEPAPPEPESPIAGSFCWAECLTSDPDACAAFYTQLFGYEVQSNEMTVGGRTSTYRMFKRGEREIGGCLELPEPARLAGAPVHWLNYILVEDVDATADRAAELGASVTCPVTDIPGLGRFCVITDPQGGQVALFSGAQKS